MERSPMRCRFVFHLLLVMLGIPRRVSAHAGESAIPGFGWNAWNFEPWVLICLALSAGMFAAGFWRLWPKAGTGRRALARKTFVYTGGWLFVAVALVSPLDRLSDVLFSAHMVQHEVLILLAAPLLVLSRPSGFALWALPRRWRKSSARFCSTGWVGRVWRRATAPLVAWTIHGMVI
jgi:putative membrane protein